LGKTLNNAYFSLKTVILRSWPVGSGYKFGAPEPTRMQYFLKGRGYLRASAGRRGAVNAFLSMMAYCGVDLDRKTYPDGRDGDTLISTWLSTFAFFLSKVIELRVLWLSGELSGWCL